MGSDNIQGESGLELSNFSGMVQRKSNIFLKRPEELWNAENVDQHVIGAVTKVKGYSQRENDLTAQTTTSTSTSTTSTTTSTSTSTT